MKIEFTARNFEVDANMRSYLEEKMNALDKHVPRRVRSTVTCAVVLEDDASGREDNRFVCEAVLTVAGTQMVSREGTVNMYAAIDIVEAKLKAQLTKYKDKHTAEPRRARILSRWMGRGTESEPEVSGSGGA